MATFLDLDRLTRPFQYYYSLFYRGRLQDQAAKSTLNFYASEKIKEAEVFMMILYLFTTNKDKELAKHYAKSCVPWLETVFPTLEDDREIGPASWALGIAYSEEIYDVDFVKSLEFFKKSAAVGHPGGQNNLGNHYRTPKIPGVEPNFQEALKWFHQAAAQGHASAKYNIGSCYFEGEGYEKNKEEAFRWYMLAAEEGHDAAQNDAAWCYTSGVGVKENHDKAVELHKRAADGGNSDAIYKLAVLYENGIGVVADLAEALRLFRRAADDEHSEAMVQIGAYYEEGLAGLETNLEEAVSWYRRAAELNCPLGQYNLAICYEEGTGVEQNDEEAFRYYELAAKQDNWNAAVSLGNMYLQGFGCTKDWNLAGEWFYKAAVTTNDEDEPDGEAFYAYAYFLRLVAMRDASSLQINPSLINGTYLEWFIKAAKNGHDLSQFSLVLYYLKCDAYLAEILMDAEFDEREVDYEETSDDDENYVPNDDDYTIRSDEDEDSDDYETIDSDEDEDQDVDGQEEEEEEDADIEQYVTKHPATKGLDDADREVNITEACKWLGEWLLPNDFFETSFFEDSILDGIIGHAISYDWVEVIEKFIEKGVNLNYELTTDGYSKKTPLEVAVLNNASKVFNLLIDHGYEINCSIPFDNDEKNSSRTQIPNQQLKKKKLLTLVNKERIPILQALINNAYPMVNRLLDEGVDTTPFRCMVKQYPGKLATIIAPKLLTMVNDRCGELSKKDIRKVLQHELNAR